MDTFYYWFVDYLYRVLGEIQMHVFQTPPAYFIQNAQKDKSPIILLAGLTLKWGFLKQIGDILSSRGFPIYIVPKLGSNLQTIPKSAALVREIIDKNDLKNVIIIGHSKGGLIGKYLLIHHNSDHRIKNLLAIASPFSGTSLAKFVPARSFKEVSPTSPVIQELSERTDVNKKIISIFPSFDNHIWPQGGSNLPGAKNIKVKVKGHHRILFDNATKKTIINCIKNL